MARSEIETRVWHSSSGSGVRLGHRTGLDSLVVGWVGVDNHTVVISMAYGYCSSSEQGFSLH